MILPATPQEMTFFELLRVLENPKGRFGRGQHPETEAAQLGQDLRMTFPTCEVEDVVASQDEASKPQVFVNAFGLSGPEGPLPLHYTGWMLQKSMISRSFAGAGLTATTDTGFRDFTNLIQHNMIAYFWRAWADNRPDIHVENDNGGAVFAMLKAMAGIGLDQEHDHDPQRADPKLHHATSLFKRVQSPDRLTEYIASVLELPVRLEEFIPVWTDIPRNLQTCLGKSASRLGRDAVVGKRFFERQGRAAIWVGPLELDEYAGLLDDPSRLEELRHALLFAAGNGVAFDVVLSLKSTAVPPARLGQTQLGRISWLGRPKTETADDRILRRFSSDPRVAA